MKSVKFLHISDLHRGGIWSNDTIGDHKDFSVSRSFAGTITSSMENDFVDTLRRWQLLHGTIDAIVCTGDLGDRGDAVKIEEGVSYIKLIQKELNITNENVLICPGNHDADRSQTADKIFLGYSDALKKNSFLDHKDDKTPVIINGIPFLIINTSLGAGEKSLFITKYKELVDGLKKKDKERFKKELKNEGVQYLDDYLDIPAITLDQRKRILKAISDNSSSFIVLVMHHNLLPNNMVEIRPYSSVLDAGKALDELITTEKNVLMVHGHVHFPSSYVMYRPDSHSFISSVGSGLFNGTSGSSVNIVELFCSDEEEHIITVVYEYIKQINGFQLKKSTFIYDHISKDFLSEVISLFSKNPGIGIKFDEIRSHVSCSEKDLLSTILLNSTVFKISRNKSTNPCDWIIHRNS